MPTVRLRKRLLDRLIKSASSAGELGLALLMTAGVVHCGGSTSTGPEGSEDAAADHGIAVEAAQEAGPGIEAAWNDADPFNGIEASMWVEAAIFPDAGSDAHGRVVEAPPPPPDAGSDAHGPVVEAAIFPDAGSDAHPNPMIEAPSPL